jgi:hypothetical protein
MPRQPPFALTAVLFALLLADAAASQDQAREHPAARGYRRLKAHMAAKFGRGKLRHLEKQREQEAESTVGIHVPAAATLFVLLLSIFGVLLHPAATRPGLLATALRLLVWKGSRRRGVLTGLRFPIHADELVGEAGARLLTAMLRHGGHLPDAVSVRSVRNTGASIRDGVKGDKAILLVEYDGPTDLPRSFFAKFNVQRLGAMRVLVETSEVCKCEAAFYHTIAASEAWREQPPVDVPRSYFVDYNEVSGEFCLLTELLRFGEGAIAPLKHRIRDDVSLDEQRSLVAAGARLNVRFGLGKRGGSCGVGAGADLLATIPRFDATHRRMWWLAQASGWSGLKHTAARTLGGVGGLNERFMTWNVPSGVQGHEMRLVRDMPAIMRDLCADSDLLAFGHNDVLLDNAYVRRGGVVGLFDWQQGCVNNVGQEWAWNFHFLEPKFLDAHEAELIELLLREYEAAGVVVDRDRFLRSYCLGTAQMFVWGGGGLQLLLRNVQKRGLLEGLVPNDPRVRGDAMSRCSEAEAELLLGAEMTRRTFTNCCNIMRRHDFARLWREWREQTGRGRVP